MPDILEIHVSLPDPHLPDANWADCFEILVPGKSLTAPEAATLTLGHMPGWVKLLMRVRNVLGAIVGLKAGAEHGAIQEERIGIFPIISRDDYSVVLGFDDWHLDFRIVIQVAGDGAGGTRLRSWTLVHRKNLFGRIYIGIVTPFHRLIVRTLLRSAVRSYSTAVTV